jgi:hypothetical protein
MLTVLHVLRQMGVARYYFMSRHSEVAKSSCGNIQASGLVTNVFLLFEFYLERHKVLPVLIADGREIISHIIEYRSFPEDSRI